MNEIPKQDPDLRRELAREAKELTDNRAFTAAINLLRKKWFGELLSEGLDRNKQAELRAKLMVLEAIPQMLNSIAHDQEFMRHGRR